MKEVINMALENEIKNNIKENLINFRKANGLTQYETATALKMKDASTYRSWETGRSSPKNSMLVRIARMYNTSVDKILTNRDDYKSSKQHKVSSHIDFDSEIYGDEYLSELERSEKLFIMKFRQLNAKDKQKVAEFLDEVLPE